MSTLVSTEIEQYVVDHTTPLPPNLQELVRVTCETMKDYQMLTGPVEGMLLQSLVWALGARRVLEIGTFTGFSAQMMAAALPDNGTVVTCENDFKHAEMAREYFTNEDGTMSCDVEKMVFSHFLLVFCVFFTRNTNRKWKKRDEQR